MHLEPLTSLKWAYQLHYYICFRTRWRNARFEGAEESAFLSKLLAEVCKHHNCHLLQHKVYPDHLRCLLSLRPDMSVSSVIDKLKTNLSREFCSRKNLEAPLWAVGYLARSAGKVSVSAVKSYVASQAAHHGFGSRARPPVFRYRAMNQTPLKARHAAFELGHHLVLASRYRRNFFNSQVGGELIEYWLKVAAKHGFGIDQATVLPEHVHMLVRIVPKMSIEQCALALMNNAQHWMGKRYPDRLVREGVDQLWQPSAYAGTCGKVSTALVKAFLSKRE
jgi:putative transposase